MPLPAAFRNLTRIPYSFAVETASYGWSGWHRATDRQLDPEPQCEPHIVLVILDRHHRSVADHARPAFRTGSVKKNVAPWSRTLGLDAAAMTVDDAIDGC